MKRLTAEWVRKAENDFLAAIALSDETAPLHEAVAFHCQQSAEKYLKALLKESGIRIPRTHDLYQLLQLVPASYPLDGFRRGLEYLTQFAVETRYPGRLTSKRQATSALRWAGKVREACRAHLGIRASKRRP